jgi:hypothetical protein
VTQPITLKSDKSLTRIPKLVPNDPLGEGFELVYDRWVDAAELRAWLASRNPAGLSGDIYAVRLDKDETPGR